MLKYMVDKHSFIYVMWPKKMYDKDVIELC